MRTRRSRCRAPSGRAVLPGEDERAPWASKSKARGPSHSSSYWSRLERAVDLAEDRRHAGAEGRQNADRDDRDQGEQERILDERLSLFAIPQGLNRKVR